MHSTTAALQRPFHGLCNRLLSRLTSQLNVLYGSWRRQRQVRSTAGAMHRLDDRTLRDIGLDRSELLSAAAELHGQAERQRWRAALLTPRH